MKAWFVRLLVMQFTLMMPVNGLRPMVSYRALELGASPLELGLVVGGYGTLSFLVAIPLGRWVDRLGEPVFLTLGAALVSLAAIWLLPVANLLVLGSVFAILGLGQVAAVIAIQTLTANGGDRRRRDARFGAHSVSAATSQMVGPPLAGLAYSLSNGSLQRVFVSAAVVVCVSVTVAASLWLWPPSEHEHRTGAGQQRDAARISITRAATTVMGTSGVPHAMLVSLAVVASIDLLAAYLPAYGEATGLSVEFVGLLLGLRAAATMAARIGMIRVVRRIGRRRVLFHATALAALGTVMLATTTRADILVVLIVLSGLGLGVGQPLSLAWIAEGVSPSLRGTAVGVRMMLNRVTQVVIPIVAGGVAGLSGIGTVFVLSGALLATGTVAIFRAPDSHD